MVGRERERETFWLMSSAAPPRGVLSNGPLGSGEGFSPSRFSPSLGVDACLSGGGLTPSARGRYQIKQDPFQAHTCDSFYQFV